MSGIGRWSRVTFVIGFLCALLLLELPAVGLLLLLVIAVLSATLGMQSLGTFFIGSGLGVVALLGQAQIRCAQDALCDPADTTGWFVAAAAVLAVGLLLVVLPTRRRVNP